MTCRSCGSLAALGRTDEFVVRDASARRLLLLALGGSAMAGGLAAAWDDRAPYALTCAGALAALGCAALFHEPARVRAAAPLGQALLALGRLRDPVLLWTFTLFVGLTVLNHVPYAFLHAYLEHVLRPWGVGPSTPWSPASWWC